ncbi:MAG: NAD/NADP octopine/nopaline dehydrogenase family protein [Chlamydiota bacterium]
MSYYKIGIVGAGNSAHALAAHLVSLGHSVTLFARDIEKVHSLQEAGGIEAIGSLQGFFPLACITNEMEELAKNSQIIFLATLTTAYEDIAKHLAPYIHKDHIIIPFSSKLCGCLEVARALEKAGAPLIPIIETDAIFDCRLQLNGSIWVRGMKAWNLYSCPTCSDTQKYGPLLNRFFKGLHPAKNILHRGLTDFGAVAHAVISIANINRIDKQEEFSFYYDGLSTRTVILLEQMEQEFHQVASRYEADILPMKDILNKYYGCDTVDLLTAMTTVPNYRHSLGPTSLNHRFLHEDVACTLVPLQQLADLAEVQTPIIDAVINLTSLLGGINLQEEGRSLYKLGWGDKTQQEIQEWIRS